jgi:hypothetical protein
VAGLDRDELTGVPSLKELRARGKRPDIGRRGRIAAELHVADMARAPRPNMLLASAGAGALVFFTSAPAVTWPFGVAALARRY